ncbi:MarR family winged helix-turn-helix transcriptional regulator [Lysobacter auxotrophicus]|uniref:MarR family transcriptional regulator n=1 Tax=Lysobacter auxotrophicus TaxID=2992573 RepID=A0ABM8DB74_9GAMM|nr:MarR family winged helix-turn-helix transcriptional regulator [Lysobacter auxotrophicus]BDU15824.1 MarR family transcriptional regulator [Lysobacter auxotrophicus]
MTDAPLPASLCTCFRLRKLSRLVTQRYDRELAAAGLNLNQYSILRRATRTPQTVGALAREIGMDRTTLSRDLKPLIAAGWIDLASSDDDARAKIVRIKPAGKRVLDRAQPLWRKAQDEIDARLGTAGVNALHNHLDRAMARMERE